MKSSRQLADSSYLPWFSLSHTNHADLSAKLKHFPESIFYYAFLFGLWGGDFLVVYDTQTEGENSFELSQTFNFNKILIQG